MGIYAAENSDVEHDAEHFADIYRDAVAIIDGHRRGLGWPDVITDGQDVIRQDVITDRIECPLCFVDALAFIAARLGSHADVLSAAKAVLTELYDEAEMTPPPGFTLPEAG